MGSKKQNSSGLNTREPPLDEEAKGGLVGRKQVADVAPKADRRWELVGSRSDLAGASVSAKSGVTQKGIGGLGVGELPPACEADVGSGSTSPVTSDQLRLLQVGGKAGVPALGDKTISDSDGKYSGKKAPALPVDASALKGVAAFAQAGLALPVVSTFVVAAKGVVSAPLTEGKHRSGPGPKVNRDVNRSSKRKDLIVESLQKGEEEKKAIEDNENPHPLDPNFVDGVDDKQPPVVEAFPVVGEELLSFARSLNFKSQWVDRDMRDSDFRNIFLLLFLTLSFLTPFLYSYFTFVLALKALTLGVIIMMFTLPIAVVVVVGWCVITMYFKWSRLSPSLDTIFDSWSFEGVLKDPTTDVRIHNDKTVIPKLTENTGLIKVRHFRNRVLRRLGGELVEKVVDDTLEISLSLFCHLIKIAYVPHVSDSALWERLVAGAKSTGHVNLGACHAQAIHNTTLMARDFIRSYKLNSTSDFHQGQPPQGGSSMDIVLAKSLCQKFQTQIREPELLFDLWLILIGGVLSKLHLAATYWTAPGHMEILITYLPLSLPLLSVYLVYLQLPILAFVAILGALCSAGYVTMSSPSIPPTVSTPVSGLIAPNTQNIGRSPCAPCCRTLTFLVILGLCATPVLSALLRMNVIPEPNTPDLSLPALMSSSSEWLPTLQRWSENFISDLSSLSTYQFPNVRDMYNSLWTTTETFSWQQIIPPLNLTLPENSWKIVSSYFTDGLQGPIVKQIRQYNYTAALSAVSIDVNSGMLKLSSMRNACLEKCQPQLAMDSLTSWSLSIWNMSLELDLFNVSSRVTTVLQEYRGQNYLHNLRLQLQILYHAVAREFRSPSKQIWTYFEPDTPCLDLPLNSISTIDLTQQDSALWSSIPQNMSSCLTQLRNFNPLGGFQANGRPVQTEYYYSCSEERHYQYLAKHLEFPSYNQWPNAIYDSLTVRWRALRSTVGSRLRALANRLDPKL